MGQLLKPYYIPIRAARITRKNWKQLKKIDTGDGVLEEGGFEDFEGDWFIVTITGNEIMSGDRFLLPAKETNKEGKKPVSNSDNS